MKHIRRLIRSVICLSLVAALGVNLPGIPVFADNSCAPGMSQLDCDAINNGWVDWVPNACAGVSVSTTTLSGNDNIEKAYNYFVSKGLDPTITAAVVGNLVEESHLDPTIVERNSKHPELPADTKDPSSLPVVDGWYGGQTRQPGWGIAQWTPSSKAITLQKRDSVAGQVYDLATQLDMVWAEMTGISPTGNKNMVEGLKQLTDLKAAVYYFQEKFEGGIGSEARVLAAQQVAANHQNSTGGDTGSTDVPAECGTAGIGVVGKCDTPAPAAGYASVKAALLTKFKVVLYGDDNNVWAIETYNTMCALAKSPTYFSQLTAQGNINIALHGGGCSGGHTGNNSDDGFNDPYGVAMFGFCNPLYNRYLLSHELGHLYSFRNPKVYQDFLSTIWSTGTTLPTWNCRYEYGHGPTPAECWADMIGEYLVWYGLRATVGGNPPGPYDFKSYQTQYGRYYNFARDKLFGGIEYTSF